ncbi:MAG: hypothetical protein K8Q97_04915 [Candidatus Andersenbacteria bacterium]|nr:hypothetical protein [Candidatus Andersenbacteria bacterium]
MKFLRTFFISIASIAALSSPSYALHASGDGGISVTPSILRIDLHQNPDMAEVIYTNRSKEAVSLHIQVKNFSALEDGWKVSFLPDNNSENFQYSLSSWIKFDNDTVLLAPQESKTVKIFIDKQNLPPGAHYASIQATIQQDNAPGTLGLKGILSSLLFIRGSTGQEIVSGTIQKLVLPTTHFSFPTNATFALNNTGNVESAPYGELRITTSSGKLVAKGVINTDSLITLPESVRSYTFPIQQLQNFISPGVYHATLSIHLDKSDQQITASRTFFSLGNVSIQEAIYAIILIILFIFIIIRLRRRR